MFEKVLQDHHQNLLKKIGFKYTLTICHMLYYIFTVNLNTTVLVMHKSQKMLAIIKWVDMELFQIILFAIFQPISMWL